MKDILQSYSGKELRRFVIEHNKKIKAKVRLEVKEIKERILKKRLIDIKGLKKDSIIEKMMEQQVFFKNIKMRKEMTPDEDEANLDKLQESLNAVINSYKKNQDESELKKSLKEIKKESEVMDLQLLKGSSIKKLETEIIKNNKVKKGQPPPKPTSKPMYKYDPVSKSLRLAPKPTQPTRKPPPPKKPEGTHKMPDGTVMSGSVHSEDSKPVKPKKKKLKIVIKEKPKPRSAETILGKDKQLTVTEKEKKERIKQSEAVKKGNLEKRKRDEELAKRLKRGDDTVTYEGKGSLLPSGNPSVNLRGFTQVWKAAGFKVIDGTAEPPLIEEFKINPQQKELALDLGLDEEDQETLYNEFISEYTDLLFGKKTLDDIEETMDEDAYRLFRFMKDKNILDGDSNIMNVKEAIERRKKKKATKVI